MFSEYLLNSFTGFGNPSMFKDITDSDIQNIQSFVQDNLADMFDIEFNIAEKCYDKRQKVWFFGGFSSKPSEFMFLPDEKNAILSLSRYIQGTVDKMGNDSSLDHFMEQIDESHESNLCDSVFGLVFGKTQNAWNNFDSNELLENFNKSMECTPKLLEKTDIPEEPKSQTHQLLKILFDTANQNHSRSKPGYRFNELIKHFAVYIRLLAGPLAYTTIHRNFELAFPSISTTNRFAARNVERIFDGHLRTQELRKYLTERNLPLIVSLSEDATRIDGRIQYDSKSNQIVGFIPPIDARTGMPIRFQLGISRKYSSTFPAVNRQHILLML